MLPPSSLRCLGMVKSHAKSRYPLRGSPLPDPATPIHIAWTKTARDGARGAATTSDVPSQPYGGTGGEEMLLLFPYPCVDRDCTRCHSAVLGGCVALAPHPDPLAEEGKAPMMVSNGLRAVANSPWSLFGGPTFQRHFSPQALRGNQPLQPPSNLSGGQCQSPLPTSSPLSTPPHHQQDVSVPALPPPTSGHPAFAHAARSSGWARFGR